MPVVVEVLSVVFLVGLYCGLMVLEAGLVVRLSIVERMIVAVEMRMGLVDMEVLVVDRTSLKLFSRLKMSDLGERCEAVR